MFSTLLAAAKWSGMFMDSKDDLIVTLHDMIHLLDGARYAVIGGMAVSALVKPRATQDIDILVESEAELQVIIAKLASKFKRHRGHAVEHKSTGVEIEILTPEFIGIPVELAKYAVDKALQQGLAGVRTRVAPPEAMIALKMQRDAPQDVADVLCILDSYPDSKVDAIMLGADENRINEIESMQKKQLPNSIEDDPIV